MIFKHFTNHEKMLSDYLMIFLEFYPKRDTNNRSENLLNKIR